MPVIVCLGHEKIVDNLALYPDEEEGTSSVVVCWKCFSMEKVVTKKQKEKKKLKLMHMETNAKELLLTFKAKL